MNAPDESYSDVWRMEAVALRDGFLQRLDPRVLLLVTLVFLVLLTSFERHALVPLLPFAAYPLFLAIAGGLPLALLAKRVLLVSTFSVLVFAFNPLFEPSPALSLYGVTVSGGWLSFASLLFRFLISAAAVFSLTGIVGFYRLALGLGRLGLPRVFVVQLLLVYRYLFVLCEEALRQDQARRLRSPGRRFADLRLFGTLAGGLLLRTLDRAERIYLAMRCRGFVGEFRLPPWPRFALRDLVFMTLWIALLLAFRFGELGERLGRMLLAWRP